MSDIIKYINIILFISILVAVASFKYPINQNLKITEKGEDTSIIISSKEDIDKFILNSSYVIAIFHADWCHHCKKFLPVFKEVSSIKVINKNWKFLNVPCSKYSQICDSFGVEGYPTVKTFKFSKEIKGRVPREFDSLVEYLQKLSSEPLIYIKDNNGINEFYQNYGTFSPLIEYNPKNEKFYSCIKDAAENEYIMEYYFGMLKVDGKNEKIIFDFDGDRVEYIWNRYCNDVKKFLKDNLYPLISNIDIGFMRKIIKAKKIIFMLFCDPTDQKVDNFIKKSFKNLSKDNRDMIFGYIDYKKNSDLTNYFKVNITQNSELKIVLYDFNTDMKYNHPNTYDINNQKDEDIEKDLRKILQNKRKIPFTSGNKFKDIMNYLGLFTISTSNQIIIFVGIIVAIITCACLALCFCEEGS